MSINLIQFILQLNFYYLIAVKGVLSELWNGIHSLEGLKSIVSAGTPASFMRIKDENHLIGVYTQEKRQGIGFRWRTFFLCSLTGIYEFYFSCHKACEWFIKESETSQANITGGSSTEGMEQQDFIA